MYKVPIDLEKYGWNETMINYLDSPSNKAIVSLYPSSLKVFSKALDIRDKYHTDLYDKVSSEYSIKNVPGDYFAPDSFSEAMTKGFKGLTNSLLWLGGGVILGAVIFGG